MGLDEFGLWGNRRGSPAGGMGLKFSQRENLNSTAGICNFAARNFRVTLSLIMETIAVNSSAKVKPVGSVYITNGPDSPEILNFVDGLKTFLSPKEEKKMGVRNPIRG